ncbi:MAG TPA: hypothetical protein PLZ15_01500 [Melioribacteraceae bacterium]|nr:hypothetical protein [Melioribacteraceae bacterium]
MNKILITVFLFLAGVNSAQVNIDSVLSSINYLEPDSVNISKIVQAQIESAKLKAIQDELKPVENKNTEETGRISIPVMNIKKTEKPGLIDYFNSLKPEVIIFISVSALLIVAVISRRIAIGAKKKVKNSFKQKIAMIREENLILKPDRKRRKVRLLLRKNKFVEKLAGQNISSQARELEISKGEILLASRIKILEYGK